MLKYDTVTFSGSIPVHTNNSHNAITGTWENYANKTVIGVVIKTISYADWIATSGPSYNVNGSSHTVMIGVRNYYDSALTITAVVNILYIDS